MQKQTPRTISVLTENTPGVLARISGMFTRRGFNIDSLAVSATEDPKISRMTVVTLGTAEELEQLIKQLNKLIPVIRVLDHTNGNLVEREIALIKFHASYTSRHEILQLVGVFRAKVVSIHPKEETIMVEITGDSTSIDAFLEALSEFTVLEMVRTGRVALMRGREHT